MASVQAADVINSLTIPVMSFLLVAIVFWASTILQDNPSLRWVGAEAIIFVVVWVYGAYLLYGTLRTYVRAGAISAGQFWLISGFLVAVSLLLGVVLGHAVHSRIR